MELCEAETLHQWPSHKKIREWQRLAQIVWAIVSDNPAPALEERIGTQRPALV
jgi:hypothetical protein